MITSDKPQTTEKQTVLECIRANLPKLTESIVGEIQQTFELWETMRKVTASSTFGFVQPYRHKSIKVSVSVEIVPDEENESRRAIAI